MLSGEVVKPQGTHTGPAYRTVTIKTTRTLMGEVDGGTDRTSLEQIGPSNTMYNSFGASTRRSRLSLVQLFAPSIVVATPLLPTNTHGGEHVKPTYTCQP